MNKETSLWYQKPASNWNEALPVGNGRLGAMIFGGIEVETLQLNEDSIWSGTKRNRNNPSSFEHLETVRQLIKDGRIPEAEELVGKALVGTPIHQRDYQTLGELTIKQSFPGKTSDYSRCLNLSSAIAKTNFFSDGINFKREIIASNPDQVICIHFSSDRVGKINFSCSIDGRNDGYDNNVRFDDHTLRFDGCTGSAGGIYFSTVISASCVGGTIKTIGNELFAKDCSEVLLVIATRTNFYTPDYINASFNDAAKALRKGFFAIKEDHVADYKSLYDRTALFLNDNNAEQLSWSSVIVTL